jgi:hypothetical protein
MCWALFSQLPSSIMQRFHFSVLSLFFVSNSLLLSSIGFISDLFSYLLLFVSDHSFYVFHSPFVHSLFLLASFRLCVCVSMVFSFRSLSVCAIPYIVLFCTIAQFKLRPLHRQFYRCAAIAVPLVIAMLANRFRPRPLYSTCLQLMNFNLDYWKHR